MKPNERNGFALVGVLWSVMLLSLCIASITTMMRGRLQYYHFVLEKSDNCAIADAAINLVLLSLLSGDSRHWPRRDNTPFEIRFHDRHVKVFVQDESGKIDINAASAETLRKLFIYAGLPADAAQTQADRIQDWREPGDLRRLNGAKAKDYEESGSHYRPRNSVFESLGEVGLVLGMSREITTRILPLITVYGEQPAVDESTAPRAVLEALHGLDSTLIDEIMATRSQSADKATTGEFSTLAGHAFRIKAQVLFNDDETIRECVVRLSADLRNPVWTYEAE